MILDQTVGYINVIPSSRTARIGKPLNVLGGVRNNTEKECAFRITLWGRASDVWKELISQDIILAPLEHKHLYFTIPERCFEPEFWGQDDLPEIELLTFHKEPAATSRGILVFVKQ